MIRNSKAILICQAIKTGTHVDIISTIAVLAAAYFWTFIFCYSGEQVTTAFKNLRESLYISDWHSYPSEMRKGMFAMLVLSRQPVHMKGFLRFKCTMTTFDWVNNAHSNWMIQYQWISTNQIIILFNFPGCANIVQLLRNISTVYLIQCQAQHLADLST